MRQEHYLDAELGVHRSIRILIVGAGGTGSAIAMGLPYLDQAMRVWGRPHGLDVTLMDADTVSETNCVRQPFAATDVGHNKAVVLIQRINLFWGTRWQASTVNFERATLSRPMQPPDIVIGCVDTRAARVELMEALTRRSCQTRYWLDLGNNAASGQFVLGEPLNGHNRQKRERLRTVGELYPEVVDVSGGEDPLPSCSALEALDRQEPYINQTLGAAALAMLAQLFRWTSKASRLVLQRTHRSYESTFNRSGTLAEPTSSRSTKPQVVLAKQRRIRRFYVRGVAANLTAPSCSVHGGPSRQ